MNVEQEAQQIIDEMQGHFDADQYVRFIQTFSEILTGELPLIKLVHGHFKMHLVSVLGAANGDARPKDIPLDPNGIKGLQEWFEECRTRKTK